MDLVDEEDNFVLEFRCLVDDHLDTLLELTTILCPGNHLRQVQGDDTLILHRKRDFSLGDTESESLDHCRLSNTWVAHETWIIFGFSIEDRDKSLDLGISTTDRVYLFFSSLLG